MSANIFKRLLSTVLAVGIALGALNVVASTADCPDCPPDKDGSIFQADSQDNLL